MTLINAAYAVQSQSDVEEIKERGSAPSRPAKSEFKKVLDLVNELKE